MPFSPIAIANEIVGRYGQNGGIDPLKLQKLIYFANGWWLATVGEPLSAEPPQVWRYGPVFQSVYRAFNRYGRQPVTEMQPGNIFGGDPLRVPQEHIGRVGSLLDFIWQEYGSKSGPALSDETHKEGTPWRQIAERHRFNVPTNEVIAPNEDWEYFSRLAAERGFPVQPLVAA